MSRRHEGICRDPGDSWWGLGAPPEGAATWPRLMTAMHPKAVGSLGPEMLAWAEEQRLHVKKSVGHRWWQRLVAHRALEHDENGRLCWRLVIVSAPRQSGKSWTERTICAWRINQAERWGEEQSLLHVAHKLIAAQEVWRPAARWAIGQDGASVRWANGEQMIQLADGSRWMIQAATDGAGVAFSLSFALIDEAWRVPRRVFDEAIEPTLAESESPQAWLVSTAGTSESDLMLSNRAAAIDSLDDPGDVLLLEWSAPPDPELDIDDPAVWRACQPHWDDRRQERLAEARATVSERAFRQQFLNMWVPGISGPLLGENVWKRAAITARPSGPVAFGVAVAPDRMSAVIVAYGGQIGEMIEHREGAGWVAGRLAELAERHQPCGIGVPKTGPAASVADEAEDALGTLLVKLTAGQLSAASGQVHDRLIADPPGLRLRADVAMAEAVQAVERKPGTGGWSWSLDGAGMIMSALSAAVWAHEHSVAEAPMVVV